MKTYMLAIALAATSVGISQTSLKETKQDANTHTEKAKETVKQTVKSTQKNASLKELKNTDKEYSAVEKEEMKAAAKRAKDGVKETKEKLQTEKDEKASDAKSALKQEASEHKVLSENIPKVTRDNAVKASDLKGSTLGQEKAAEAKKMIELKEVEMTTNDAYIAESRTRISIAEKSLQDQIAAGTLSEDAITSKKAIIEKAKTRLANYEANVKKSKLALKSQKNKIVNLYENQ